MPNTREKLIELIRKPIDIMPGRIASPYIKFTLPYAEELADHLVANGVTVQKWIPVTERLPEKEGTYLTYTEKERIHLDCFCIYPNHGTQFWVGGNGTVTHWMPLPEPPKGE